MDPRKSGAGKPESAPPSRNPPEAPALSADIYIDSSDPFRMGGPGPLPPNPVVGALSLAESPSQGQYLVDTAYRWCTSRGVHCSASMYLRYNYGSEPRIPEDVTLVITADKLTNVDDSWVVLINNILELFNQKEFHGRVEIRDPIAGRGKKLFPLGQDNEFIPIWSQLEPRFREILQPTDWMTMVPLRRGYSEAIAQTTIMITAKDLNSETWKNTLKLLSGEVAQYGLTREAEMVLQGSEGLWGVFANDNPVVNRLAAIPDEVYSRTGSNMMGVSLQCHGISRGGTIGGFVRLQANDGRQGTISLTCHHVIAQHTPFLKEANENGCPNFRRQFSEEPDYLVNVPHSEHLLRTITRSTRDLEFVKNKISESPTAAGPRQEYAEQTEKLRQLNRQPTFGKVVATSGFRSVSKLASELPVMKRGSVTGLTVGTVNDKSTWRMNGWPDDVANQSYFVLSDSSMAEEGDSGSWLVDEEGKLLGIVHAGDSASGAALVIPIDDIFTDIKRMTGFTVDLNV